MLRPFKILFLFIFSLILHSVSGAMTPEKVGLHLSFEERLAITYGLMAQGESEEVKTEIVARAKKYFLGLSKMKVKTIKVKNFNEFLRLHKGDWPNTHSVSLDLEIIEAKGPRGLMIFEGATPRVQRQIDTYMAWRHNQLAALIIHENTRVSAQLDTLVETLTKNKSFPIGLKSWILNQLENVIGEKMKELDRIGEKIADSNLAQQQDAKTRIALQTIFSEYFSHLSSSSKKLLISSYLGGNLHLTDMQKFEVMVQNSGPQLQKLLQVVARLGGLEVFQVLENSVRPVPWVLVEQILNLEKEGVNFMYFERKPLGVGTMAQVHRAKIRIQNEVFDVVVRFIKPGMEERVEEDRRILGIVAKKLDTNPEFRKTGAPKMTPIVEDIAKTVSVELDQNVTKNRQKMARSPYNKTAFLSIPGYKNEIQFYVPKIFEGKADSKLMIQEMVLGGKLDKTVSLYADLAQDMKRVIIEEMARLWIQEMMFGGGFYHSDLHQGNFMVRITDQKITVNILDYGMGGVISKELQGFIMLLGVGAELLDPDMMARAYWAISDQKNNTLTEPELKKILKEKIQRVRQGKEKKLSMEIWTAFVMESGLQLPYEFVSLNRGIVIIGNLLKDAGSKLTVNKMVESMAKRHPWLVYNTLVLNNGVSHKALAELGWIKLNEAVGIKPLPPTSRSTRILRCEEVFP